MQTEKSSLNQSFKTLVILVAWPDRHHNHRADYLVSRTDAQMTRSGKEQAGEVSYAPQVFWSSHLHDDTAYQNINYQRPYMAYTWLILISLSQTGDNPHPCAPESHQGPKTLHGQGKFIILMLIKITTTR